MIQLPPINIRPDEQFSHAEVPFIRYAGKIDRASDRAMYYAFARHGLEIYRLGNMRKRLDADLNAASLGQLLNSTELLWTMNLARKGIGWHLYGPQAK